jgi:hypothetical protein
MTVWGIGPRFALLSAIYGILVLALQEGFMPLMRFFIISDSVSLVLGSALMALGLPVFLMALVAIHRHFGRGSLCNTGVYARFRHLVYAAWIVFFVPGWC